MKNIFWKVDGIPKAVIITKASRPKFSSKFGRSWDTVRLSLGGVDIEAWLDTTWGRWIYFMYENAWYKLKLFSDYEDKDHDYSIEIGRKTELIVE